jgi:hypothetical protein
MDFSIKTIKRTISIITEALTEASADTLPLTSPTTPLKEVVVEGFKPHRPSFHSNHGAKAPYLY